MAFPNSFGAYITWNQAFLALLFLYNWPWIFIPTFSLLSVWYHQVPLPHLQFLHFFLRSQWPQCKYTLYLWYSSINIGVYSLNITKQHPKLIGDIAVERPSPQTRNWVSPNMRKATHWHWSSGRTKYLMKSTEQGAGQLSLKLQVPWGITSASSYGLKMSLRGVGSACVQVPDWSLKHMILQLVIDAMLFKESMMTPIGLKLHKCVITFYPV